MIISRLILKNWRNFRQTEIKLQNRQFIVGPNASGKSNLLDALRFLRDIAKSEGGGLQKAVKDRGGISKLRSLSARKHQQIEIEVYLAERAGKKSTWRYAIGIIQQARGKRQTLLSYERVRHQGRLILNRPDAEDAKDTERLSQTFLEQINANQEFREVSNFLQSITYIHLVPQLLRFADQIQGRIIESDPFGQGFLERIAKTPEKIRKKRLLAIEKQLRIAVPQLQQLQFYRDKDTGRPHLQALYQHWRPNAGKQLEDQFSDGTLRLIGLFWALLDGDAPLLLEEPELSLNASVVAQLAPIFHKLGRIRKRQIIVSTHSEALLNEPGIDGREVVLLKPDSEGTAVSIMADQAEAYALLVSGLSAGEVALAQTAPTNVSSMGRGL